MPVDLSRTLVIGISSSALFDMSDADAVFQSEGLAAYSRHQIERADQPLPPGTGMPLVRAILRLNELAKDLPGATRKAEVVVASKNAPATSMRLYNSIEHHGLHDIQRSFLTGGEKIAQRLTAFDVDLFLSTNQEDVEEALSIGIPAARVYRAPESLTDEIDQIRIAFDGDAVLFSGESEDVYQQFGLERFVAHEVENQNVPLPEGPFFTLLKVLSFLQTDPHLRDRPPVRIALITARSMPAHRRVIQTLETWNVRIDEAYFMGGVPKTKILSVFRPHIYFDDQDVHCSPASRVVPTGLVPRACLREGVDALPKGVGADISVQSESDSPERPSLGSAP